MSRYPAHNLVRETIGETAWPRLVAWCGGTEYDVPERLDTPSGVELASRIGAEAARKLIRWAKGSRIYVAAGHAETLLSRYRDIQRLHEEGQSVREIAMSYDYHGKYTERTIRSVLSGRLDALEEQFGQQMELPGM